MARLLSHAALPAVILAALTIVGLPWSSAEGRVETEHPQKPGTRSQLEKTKRNDDLTLGELQAIVLLQAQTIQVLRSDLESEKNYARSLSGSLDTLNNLVTSLQTGNGDLQNEVESLREQITASSKEVGFSVRFKTDGGQFKGIPLGQHSTLIFDDVITNVGNGYNNHTGIFTAPVSGLYSFFLTQMTADNVHELWLSIQRGSAPLDWIYTEGAGPSGGGDTHDSGASQVTAHLQAGQNVWVRQERGAAVRGEWFTVFTGYLIQAD